jgi:choline-glycine betaine transporter
MSRPDYHDPTRGLGGAAPAQSALTLRLVLALFGLATCAALCVVAIDVGIEPLAGIAAALALAAAVDAAIVIRRKFRGEPG